MATSKTYTSREVEKILRKNGWILYRHGKGSHKIYVNRMIKAQIMLPRSMDKMLVNRELKKYGLIE